MQITVVTRREALELQRLECGLYLHGDIDAICFLVVFAVVPQLNLLMPILHEGCIVSYGANVISGLLRTMKDLAHKHFRGERYPAVIAGHYAESPLFELRLQLYLKHF